ncbi:MAG: hypothetical protein AAGF85_00515 [Bacteroidota bacterium]
MNTLPESPGLTRSPINKPKLRPILFSTPMIQAILEGRKTQTRRVMKPQPKQLLDFEKAKCPYGEVGDILWVREAFKQVGHYSRDYLFHQYKADGQTDDLNYPEFLEQLLDGNPWKPSIHMPFKACRLFLRVMDKRVHLINTISDEESEAEGVEKVQLNTRHAKGTLYRDYSQNEWDRQSGFLTPTGSFIRLWNSINGNRPGYAWKDNPWVWAITFEVIDRSEVGI